MEENTATKRAAARAKYGPGGTREAARSSWKAHYNSKKPMSQWEAPKGADLPQLLESHTKHHKGARTLKSGAPMRSIKENLVNRGPGQRAAASYLGKAHTPKKILTNSGDLINYPKSVRSTSVKIGAPAARKYLAGKTSKTGLLKSMAKAAGKVGARLAGPVGAALTAYDAYDTAKTTKETVGAAMELGKVRAAGRAAEAGTAAIEKAMKAKYPLAGSSYEAIGKKLPKLKSGTKATGGILKVN